MRGSGRCAGWPVRRSRRPGSHPPARHALSAYQTGCRWGRQTTRPGTATYIARARPTTGAGSVQYPADAPDGVKGRLTPRSQASPGRGGSDRGDAGAFVEVERKWPVGGRQRGDVEGAAGARSGWIIRAATDTGADREAKFTARAEASFANIATCANEAGRTNHATCAGCAGCATSAGSAKWAGSATCTQFARSALVACHAEGAKAADQAVTVGSVSTSCVCPRAEAS
jgi:hypothetical protein